MKASKVLTLSMSVFRGRISWCFSLSKNNISPAAPDLELVLLPLWYWPIMNAHTKQPQDKVFETDFTDSQKSDPPFVHLLALSHIYIFCSSSIRSSNNHSTVWLFMHATYMWRLFVSILNVIRSIIYRQTWGIQQSTCCTHEGKLSMNTFAHMLTQNQML